MKQPISSEGTLPRSAADVIGSNTSVDLVGKYIYVVVTATKDNHKTQTFTDITDKDTNGSDTVRRVITSFDVTLDNDKFEYDGTPKTPNVTVKAENTELVEQIDYLMQQVKSSK